jgi:hypothetical protein
MLIVSATLSAPDRSLGYNQSSSTGDWILTGSKPRKGLTFYSQTTTDITSSDQTSSLVLTDLTTAAPEPGSVGMMAFGGLLLAALYRFRASRLAKGHGPRSAGRRSATS